MNKEELFEAFGGVEDKHLEVADNYKRTSVLTYLGILAASVCLIIGGLAFYYGFSEKSKGMSATNIINTPNASGNISDNLPSKTPTPTNGLIPTVTPYIKYPNGYESYIPGIMKPGTIIEYISDSEYEIVWGGEPDEDDLANEEWRTAIEFDAIIEEPMKPWKGLIVWYASDGRIMRYINAEKRDELLSSDEYIRADLAKENKTVSIINGELGRYFWLSLEDSMYHAYCDEKYEYYCIKDTFDVVMIRPKHINGVIANAVPGEKYAYDQLIDLCYEYVSRVYPNEKFDKSQWKITDDGSYYSVVYVPNGDNENIDITFIFDKDEYMCVLKRASINLGKE